MITTYWFLMLNLFTCMPATELFYSPKIWHKIIEKMMGNKHSSPQWKLTPTVTPNTG